MKRLLTIGIPTYNGGKHIPELLASVKNLKLDDEVFEILIVDNNSDDNTDEIVNALRATHNNIVYYNNETNIGRIQNWNRVIDLAQGKYLVLMNVNDLFLEYNAAHVFNFLEENTKVPTVMNDVMFGDFRHPNWVEKGIIDFNSYIRKTFLDVDYLEFNSLGILQQHIFRTEVIKSNNIRFDISIPRTTDRVFVAEVIRAGGGKFYYSATPVVHWRTNAGRYHDSVHKNSAQFDFGHLWGNEYEANIQVAGIAGISFAEVLKSQLIMAVFLKFAKWFRSVRSTIVKAKAKDDDLEIATSDLYYQHLIRSAKDNELPVSMAQINIQAFRRATMWMLRSLKILKKNPRSIKDALITTYSAR